MGQKATHLCKTYYRLCAAFKGVADLVTKWGVAFCRYVSYSRNYENSATSEDLWNCFRECRSSCCENVVLDETDVSGATLP